MLDQPRRGAAYCVFGRVVDGMDVVEEIYNVETGFQNNMRDVPLEAIVIEKAERISREEALQGASPETSP
jgi:peptidyl-prolyl cis-trans isomerase B (cyclophilin B)